MELAKLVAIFTAVFVALFLAFIPSLDQWGAEQEKARLRRLAEHKMNARLLRLNI